MLALFGAHVDDPSKGVNDITHMVADRGGKEFNKIGRVNIFIPEGHQVALDLGRIRDVEIVIISLP